MRLPRYTLYATRHRDTETGVLLVDGKALETRHETAASSSMDGAHTDLIELIEWMCDWHPDWPEALVQCVSLSVTRLPRLPCTMPPRH